METKIRKWLKEIWGHVQEHPARAPLYFVYTAYLSVWYAITSRHSIGKNIYESDWDLLIVLDACRVDTLREVADEYEFIQGVSSIYSVGSQSAEWMVNTFTEDWQKGIKRTAYISGNGYSSSVLRDRSYPPANNTVPVDWSSWSVVVEDMFHSHRDIWEFHNKEYKSVLPRQVTDYTIREGREGNSERIIAHYTQPHLPYIGKAYQENREPTELEKRGYELLQEGSASREAVYKAYKETLRWVLDDVEVLLNNVDAEKVVITADHGEAFGEWKAYGHPEGFPHPVVRKVPWVETTARDTHTRNPRFENYEEVDTDIKEHLQDLGYR